MDSTPRHVWVEKGGGLEKNGVLSKERRTDAQKKQQKERATFTNPKHIIYIKGLFFVSDSFDKTP